MSRRAVGSITKRGDRWRARVEASGALLGGKRYLSETCDTRQEAEAAVARMSALLQSSPRAGDPVTLAWYWENMFKPSRDGLTNATKARYMSCWRNHIAPAFGARPINSIRHAEVQRWLYGMTRGTAQHCLATLRAILRQAYADEVIDREPMRGTFRLPGAQPAPLPVWTADEVARAMPVLARTPLYRLWLVMVGGGCRREEAYALFERDLSYEVSEAPDGSRRVMASATVDDAVTPEDGRKAPKNPHSYRVVAIAEPFASELMRTAPDDPGAPLCAYSLANVGRKWPEMWKPRAEGRWYPETSCRGIMLPTGVPYVPLSRMRATHETLAQLAGVPDTLNAAMHGRSNVQTGYRHYLVPGGEALGTAAQGVGALVEGALMGPEKASS